MSEALVLRERILHSIELGESHFREFKSGYSGEPGKKKARSPKEICADIAEALVSFANADGGDLLVGIEDDGELTGLPHGDDAIRQMLASAKTHIYGGEQMQLERANRVHFDDKVVLLFSVSKGTSKIYQLSDGRCVRRQDLSTVPASADEIAMSRQEVLSREFDRKFDYKAKVNDLNIQLVDTIAKQSLKRITVEKFLQQMDLADYTPQGVKLRKAALLLFADKIRRWHNGCKLRILKIDGTELKPGEDYNVVFDDEIEGNIFQLLEESWDRIRPFLASRTVFGAGAKFEQQYLYPEQACREAIVNAIAHRDYSIEKGIEVFVFDDRLEVKSPGRLLSTVTVQALEQLDGLHESRNPLIGKLLRETRYMRELGEGMKRIFQSLAESELEKPTLNSDSASFTVGFHHKSIYTHQQMDWLGQFDHWHLTPLQKRIVVLGMGGGDLSQDDIYSATSDMKTYQNEVTPLTKYGILVKFQNQLQVANKAKALGIARSKVPRFRVFIPQPGSVDSADKNSKITQASRSFDSDSTVYVGNLPGSATEADLRQLFELSGIVMAVTIPKDDLGLTRNYGFVQFSNKQSAIEAIMKMNGLQYGTAKLSVRQYKKKTYRG